MLALASVAALAILAGGVVLVDRFASPAGSALASPSVSPGSPTEPAAATATAGVTLEPSPASAAPASAAPASPTTPVIGSPGPGSSPELVAAETPDGAVAAFLEARGIPFAGACAVADPVADAGSYCAELADDRPGLQVHRIGPVASEPDTWLLVADGQFGWAVIEWAPIGDPAASPPF